MRLALPIASLLWLLLPVQSHAAAFMPCSSGCTFQPGVPAYGVDWTIEGTGEWNYIRIEYRSDDPNLRFRFPTFANQWFTTQKSWDANGRVIEDLVLTPFSMTMMTGSTSPGVLQWNVRTPKAYDFCDHPSSPGLICARTFFAAWNNGSPISFESNAPLYVRVSVTIGSQPIPEPTTWAMLFAGFGMIGTALRRKRSLANERPRVGPALLTTKRLTPAYRGLFGCVNSRRRWRR